MDLQCIVSMLKIRALVLMIISTFLFIIGQIPGMEIITDIARDLKATRKKNMQIPTKMLEELFLLFGKIF